MALGYRVAILSVWWNRGELDTRFFSSKANQKTYFDNIGLTWNSLNNFNINDNITTTIIFRDNSGRTIDTLLKCNYAIVKDKNENYRYYFITNIVQDSSNQIMTTLELDDIQNNLIGNVDKFNYPFVKNWTGNNYVYDTILNTYRFDFTGFKTYQDTGDAPQLFNRNSNEVFMRYTDIEAVDTWLNENIEAWRYVFVNDNNQLGAPQLSNTSQLNLITSECLINIGAQDVRLPYGAISCPIYKKASTKRIYIKYDYNGNTYYMKLMSSDIDGFFMLQDANISNYPIGTYAIEEKISNVLPYGKLNSFISNYTIDNDGDLIINATIPTGGDAPKRSGYEAYYMSNLAETLGTTKADANLSVVSGYFQKDNNIVCTSTYQANFNFSTPYNENMKLLDINYSKLRLRIANQFYDYNPLAYFNAYNKDVSMLYTEALKVGISKIYFRLDYKGEYRQPNLTDYTGLVTSLDLTEPLLTNQWSEYLAQHKNYYLQTAFNNAMSLSTGMLGSKNSKQAIKSGMSTFASIYNEQLDRENMQQSPNALANANGDPYFNLKVEGIKPRLEYLSVADATKQSIISNFKEYGVPYNRIIELSQVLDSHSSYDFVSCIINKVDLNLSTKEYIRIKDIMASGRRFWYTDNVNLSALNYYKN